MRVVVLLSGGIDSTTTLAYAISRGYEVYPITIDYEQRHRREIESVKNICRWYSLVPKIVKVDLRSIGGSALTAEIEVPTRSSIDEIREDIPITYVPARNLIFLSIAGAYAEVIDARSVFIGANIIDYSGYPDCRPEFIFEFQRVLNLATKAGVSGKKISVEAPLLYLKKSQIISLGMKLGVPYELTWSCYRGGDIACGQCDSCLIRLNGFFEAGYRDPLPYERYPEFYRKYLEGSL